MKHSVERLLTTHVGSLIRPPEFLEHLRARNQGKGDAQAYDASLKESVAAIVRQQAEIGLDVVSDGEFGKTISWSQYALERLSGFSRRPVSSLENPFARGADREKFPEFYDEMDKTDPPASDWESVCTGPIAYTGLPALNRDIENFRAALKGTAAVTDAFMPVAAPASVIPDRRNEYYKTEDDCLEAIANAMRTEYRTIVDAGFILQLDDARTAVTYDRMVPPASFADYRKWVGRHVEILNHALEGIPEDRIRYHVCWGSWPGPHVTDVGLKDIVDLILQVRVGAYVIEGANPRHEHEWRVWEQVKMPAGRILIPGVISHATNIVEHPELVAERLLRYARPLGRENIIGGTDCGFAQGPFRRRVHPSIMWAKLQALVDGAKLASKTLWA